MTNSSNENKLSLFTKLVKKYEGYIAICALVIAGWSAQISYESRAMAKVHFDQQSFRNCLNDLSSLRQKISGLKHDYRLVNSLRRDYTDSDPLTDRLYLTYDMSERLKVHQCFEISTTIDEKNINHAEVSMLINSLHDTEMYFDQVLFLKRIIKSRSDLIELNDLNFSLARALILSSSFDEGRNLYKKLTSIEPSTIEEQLLILELYVAWIHSEMEMINTGNSLDFSFVTKIFEEFYPRYGEFHNKYVHFDLEKDRSNEEILFRSLGKHTGRLNQLRYSVKYFKETFMKK